MMMDMFINCEVYCLMIIIDNMIDTQTQEISWSYPNIRDYNGEYNCVEMKVFDDDDG